MNGHVCDRRYLTKLFKKLHTGPHSKIAGRPRITAAKAGHQVNIGRPLADTTKFFQFGSSMIVIKISQRCEVERSLVFGFRRIDDGRRLGTGQAVTGQIGHLHFAYACHVERRQGGFNSRPDRVCGFRGNQLPDHNVSQTGQAAVTSAQPWQSVPLMQDTEPGIKLEQGFRPGGKVIYRIDGNAGLLASRPV